MTDLKPTAATAWKSVQTEVVTLPSGNTAELKEPDLFALFATGRAPKFLKDSFAEGAQGNATPVDVSDESLADMGELANLMVETCFVSPKVVTAKQPDPERNEIGLSQVTAGDKMFVMSWAMSRLGFTEANPAFRVANKSAGEPLANVRTIGDVQRDGRAPQRDSGI